MTDRVLGLRDGAPLERRRIGRTVLRPPALDAALLAGREQQPLAVGDRLRRASTPVGVAGGSGNLLHRCHVCLGAVSARATHRSALRHLPTCTALLSALSV